MSSNISLRPYQEAAIKKTDLHIKQRGGRSGILHLFTGAGKSVITTHMVERLWNPQEGYRTWVIGGINQNLTYQMYNNFKAHFPYMTGNYVNNGINVPYLGIVMGSLNQCNARVVIASIMTLLPRHELTAVKKPREADPIKKDDFFMDKHGNIHLSGTSEREYLVSPRVDELLANGGLPHLWVHDEAHHAVADGSVMVIQRLDRLVELTNSPQIKIIGNTATPSRADGRGLHTLFERVLCSYDVKWGQNHGYLVPFADPQRVLIDMEEYDSSGNGSKINDDKTTLQYVDNWAEIIVDSMKDLGPDRIWLNFWGKFNGQSAIDDSRFVTAAMNAGGIRAAHVDGKECVLPTGDVVPKSVQGDIIEALNKGKLQACNNHGVFVEGTDIPRIDGIIIGRKIASDNPTLMTQLIGRGLRPHPDKTDLLIVEVVGQGIEINGVADLMGYTVDPATGQYVEEMEIQQIIKNFLGLWRDNPEEVERWIQIQIRWSEARIREAIQISQLSDVEDQIQHIHLKILRQCYEYISDEDRLLEDIDTRDIRDENKIRGVNATYDLIQIKTKSKASWYIDHDTAIMTLPVGEGSSFAIHPPNHTYAGYAERMVEILLDKVNNEVDHPVLAGKEDRHMATILEFFNTAHDLFSNFTLWHVDTQKPWNPFVPSKLWTMKSTELDTLESDAFAFARDHLQDYVASFADKKKRKQWQYKDPSDKQWKMACSIGRLKQEEILEQYGTVKDGVVKINRGELSELINHWASIKPVGAIVQKFISAVDKVKDKI